MPAHNIAYRRVSTISQDTARQLDGMSFDVEFEDKVSGKSRDRPELIKMISQIRAGDKVTVHSIDRLARNMVDLLALIKQINNKGASLEFQKEGLTFTGDDSPMQTLQLQIMGAVAEFERSIINERCAEGRAIAMKDGKKFGRKSVLTNEQQKQVCSEFQAKKSVANIAIDMDVSRPVIYRVLQNEGLHKPRKSTG